MTTLRYWAAAREAAGEPAEDVSAATLGDALEQARTRHGERFAQVLARCAFVVDGDPVGVRDHRAVALSETSLVDVLPPFAGG